MKTLSLEFWNGRPNYQGLVLLSIGLEQKMAQIYFSPKNVYYESLSGNIIILSL